MIATLPTSKNNSLQKHQVSVTQVLFMQDIGHSEPAPTSAPRRMNHGKWSGNSFLLAFSSQANHGG
jgi:hypothetical protein